jgi:hypothetical protein
MFSQTYFCLVTHSLDKFMVYLDFTHQTGILRCPTTAGLTPEVIVVISRETNDFLDIWIVILQNVIYALRWINALTHKSRLPRSMRDLAERWRRSLSLLIIDPGAIHNIGELLDTRLKVCV